MGRYGHVQVESMDFVINFVMRAKIKRLGSRGKNKLKYTYPAKCVNKRKLSATNRDDQRKEECMRMFVVPLQRLNFLKIWENEWCKK